MKKQNWICLFSSICLTVFFISCDGKPSEKKFFDIPGYFKTEIDSLKKSRFLVSKIAVYNNDTSKQQLRASEMNWKKEFAIFLDSDINKPVYYANMEVQTIPQATGRWYIYKSKNPKTPIQDVEYHSGGGMDFVNVIIRIVKENLISSTNILVYYSTGRSYLITGSQKIRNLGEENHFMVEGRFK